MGDHVLQPGRRGGRIRAAGRRSAGSAWRCSRRAGMALFAAGSVGCALSERHRDPDRVSLRAGRGRGDAARRSARAAVRAERIALARTVDLDRRGHVRSGGGTGARRDPHAGIRLAARSSCSRRPWRWSAWWPRSSPTRSSTPPGSSSRPGRTGAAAPRPTWRLASLFGALVGALFLAVLLVINGWGLSPIAGAAVVSALPLAALGGAAAGRRAVDPRPQPPPAAC